MSTRSRRDYIHQVFERQCEVALANLERDPRSGSATAWTPSYVCGTDFGTQTSAFCSVATFRELWLPYYREINDWIHANTDLEMFQTFLRQRGAILRVVHRGRLRHHQPGAVLGRRHGPRAC